MSIRMPGSDPVRSDAEAVAAWPARTRASRRGRTDLRVAAAMLVVLTLPCGFATPAAGAPAEKPLAPLDLEYALPRGAVDVGTPVELVVTLAPAVPLEDVSVQLAVDDGLYVAPTDVTFTAARASAQSPVVWTTQLVPLRPGRFLVRLVASGTAAGEPQARAVVVPLVAGLTPAGPVAAGRLEPTTLEARPEGDSPAGGEGASPRSRRKGARQAATAAAAAEIEAARAAGERLIRLPADERR